MKRAVAIGLLAGSLAAGQMPADVVVQRWGVAGHVQHAGTLAFQDLRQRGTLMTFDLAALPKAARVYRARLKFVRPERYDRAFHISPADAKGQATGERLKLLPPTWRWFDATEVVRTWAAAGAKKGHLLLRSAPRFQRDGTFLEVAYEGRLADPPKQVRDVRAFCRAGQVFVTFRETEDLSEGRDDYAWGLLIKKSRGYDPERLIPKDDPREVRYRVYRHDEPITAANIARAELLADVAGGSRFNTRQVRRIWRGEQTPSTLDEKYIAVRLAVEDDKPLPSGVGKFVRTVRRAGRGYYAVVTAVNGAENTTDITRANTAGPVDERPAPGEPVVYRKVVHDLKRPPGTYVQLWCNWYCEAPLSPIPMCYDVVVGFCPQRRAKRAPVHINRGHSWIQTAEPVRPAAGERIDLAHCCDWPNAFWMGVNDAAHTLKGIEEGRWQPFPMRRQEALLAWLDRRYGIDRRRITAALGAWGMMEIERGDLYADLHGWGLPEISKGFQAWQRAKGVWGPPSAYAGRPPQEDPFRRQDWTRFVLADPRREIPFLHMHLGWGAHFTEMGWPPVPRFLRAMIDTKRAFVYHWRVPDDQRPAIRLDRSLPAFGHCSLDDNPGNGDLNQGEGMGIQLNGYLTWDAGSLVDEPGRWEVTAWLAGKPPLPRCTVDLTPRRCRRFRARAGETFAWTSTPQPTEQMKRQAIEDGRPVPQARPAQRGTATADKWGLVTIRGLRLTGARHRVVLRRRGRLRPT